MKFYLSLPPTFYPIIEQWNRYHHSCGLINSIGNLHPIKKPHHHFIPGHRSLSSPPRTQSGHFLSRWEYVRTRDRAPAAIFMTSMRKHQITCLPETMRKWRRRVAVVTQRDGGNWDPSQFRTPFERFFFVRMFDLVMRGYSFIYRFFITQWNSSLWVWMELTEDSFFVVVYRGICQYTCCIFIFRVCLW